MTLISLKNLDVTIGKKQILKNIDLEVEKGSVTVFIGPSGSGKTTLLRTINLLQKPSQGILRISLILNGKYSKSEAKEIALQALKDVGLEKFASQYPATLSGGQQQRVAIARAVAFHPEVILFDEPTSSLDPEMVESVLQVIVNLAKKNITMILVTHEMEFARKIADKAVFIENGEILTQGDAKILLSNEGSHDRVRSFVNSLYRGTPESAEL